MHDLNQGKISTGFKDLDAKIDGGFYPGTLVCLGGRPAMGKTALMLSMCNNLQKENECYKFISLEENKERIMKRSKNFINLNNVNDIITDMVGLEKFIGIHPSYFSIFFLDGFQLLRESSGSNSYCEVSCVVRKLKKICMEMDVCIVFSCPLSRKVEERQGHWPRMSDLRDSGEIEEICDLVLLLLRRDYYDVLDKPGRAELIIAKNRQGFRDCVNLDFDEEKSLFSDYVPLKYTAEEEAAVISAFGAFMPSD